MANTWKCRAEARQLWARLGPKLDATTHDDETAAYEHLYDAILDSYSKRPAISPMEAFSIGGWMMDLAEITVALTANGRTQLRLKWT